MQSLMPELSMPPAPQLPGLDGPSDPQHATGRANWERLQSVIAHDAPCRPSAAAPVGTDGVANAGDEAGRAGAAERGKPYLRGRKRRALDKLQRAHDAVVAGDAGVASAGGGASEGVIAGRLVPKGESAGATGVVAMDCEMVGVGEGGVRSALARVCVVRPAVGCAAV